MHFQFLGITTLLFNQKSSNFVIFLNQFLCIEDHLFLKNANAQNREMRTQESMTQKLRIMGVGRGGRKSL